MDSFPWQHLPDQTATMPPGPELLTALTGLDVRRLPGTDLETLLKAQQRQINALHAAQLATMYELGLRDDGPAHPATGPARKKEPDEFSSDLLRAPLKWTRRTADTAFTLAWDLQTRLPEVYRAMQRGALDWRRVAIFSEWTMCLTDAQARIVCGRVLPDAPGLTTGQLIERLKRECIAIDPDWAARRYADALKQRRLWHSVNPDGSANLSGSNLPLDEAATAKATVDRLVKKAKAAGDPRRRDLIATDIYLGLLSTYRTLTDAQIIKDLINRATHEHNPDDPDDPDDGGRESRDDRAGSGTAWDEEGQPADPDGDLIPAGWVDHPDHDTDHDTGPDGGTGSDGGTGRGDGGCPPSEPSPETPGPGVRAGVEVRIELTTLLGWDDHPAHIPGWDHTHALLGRRMAHAQTRGEWRYAIAKSDGRLHSEGITRVRPQGWREGAPPSTGGVVEIAIPHALLQELAANPAQTGVWAAVITDIATQVTATEHQNNPPGQHPQRSQGQHDQGQQDRDGQSQDSQDQPGQDGQDGLQRDVLGRDVQRFPLIGLRRHTQIRDRQCCAPGCRAPAMACDADHITQHTDGGATTAENLQSLCAHDHALKDRGRWKAKRLDGGTTRWTTRHGTVHYVQPPLIISDLPPPHPRT